MSHFVFLPDHCYTQHHTSPSQVQILPENKQQQGSELTRLVATPWGEASGTTWGEASGSAPPGAGSAGGVLPESRTGGGGPSTWQHCWEHLHQVCLLPCPYHQFAEQPFQHLLRMSCHAGKARTLVLNQLRGERKPQFLYSSRPYWNGVLISGLAEKGECLEQPR